MTKAAILLGRMSWAMINFGLLTWGPSYLGRSAVPRRRARHYAVRSVKPGALCPAEPPTKADQPQTRCIASRLVPIQLLGSPARASAAEVQKCAAWCMIRVSYAAPELDVTVSGGASEASPAAPP